jgi:hypothetical protein
VTTEPKNHRAVLLDAQQLFSDLRAGTIETKRAAEMANIIGKQIALVKLSLEYAAQKKEKPSIQFLDK